MSSSKRLPMEGQSPLFEFGDPRLFPINETPASRAYYAALDHTVETTPLDYNSARRRQGWPPDLPRGPKLCQAVLDHTIDYHIL